MATAEPGLVGVLPLLSREMDPGRLLASGTGASVPVPRRRQRERATR